MSENQKIERFPQGKRAIEETISTKLTDIFNNFYSKLMIPNFQSSTAF